MLLGKTRGGACEKPAAGDNPAPVVIVRRLDEADARALGEALAEIELCRRLLKLTQR